MEPFSKLRPPDAIRIKVRLADGSDDTCSIDSRLTQSSSFSHHNSLFRNSKKFCVDPQITSYDVLYSLIGQAFGLNLSNGFQMSYLNKEFLNYSSKNAESETTEYISLYNDWDLDAAFLNSSNPYLAILLTPAKITNPGPSSTASNTNYDEWDVISTHDLLKPIIERTSIERSLNKSYYKSGSLIDSTRSSDRRSLLSMWSNSAADKAVSVFQKMFNGISRSNSFTSTNSSNQSQVFHSFNSSSNMSYSQYNPHSYLANHSPFMNNNTESISHESLMLNGYSKPPLGDAEYRNFTDSDGRIVQLSELRQRIFDGGCEPSRRKELWPLLLDIYPNSNSMTSKQRSDFINLKSVEYNRSKSTLWFNLNKSILKSQKQFDISNVEPVSTLDTDQLSTLAHKIQKDVWRTDRYHKFYAGDSNKNVESLFNILMTYSLSNDGFYVQGMSDLLSPLLFVLRDEPLAYICFQSLMTRCTSNFDILSETIAYKIELLTNLISRYDPVFWMYLSQFGANQLVFTYRWLLIECKREFPINDSLRVLEVMWSTIEAKKSSVSFETRSSSDASSVNIRKSINQCVDDYLTSDVEYSDINCLESSSITSNERISQEKLSTPNLTDNKAVNKEQVCEFCTKEKGLQNNKEINNNELSSSDTSSSSSAMSSESESSDEKEVKELDEVAFKLNRKRWRNYRRAQQANRTRTRRPRYFSLNVLVDKLNIPKTNSTTDSETTPKKPSEKPKAKHNLCLSNLELKKRQLEDKYESHSSRPLAATNYLLSKETRHKCLLKNKARSSSMTCSDCISSSEIISSASKNFYKKRNSLFGMTPQQDLLSVLPRLMNLSNLTELPQENSTSGSSFKNLSSPLVDLENIQENEEDFDTSTKSNQKKKLRKKLRDIKKPTNKKESSQKGSLKKTTPRIIIEKEDDKNNEPKQFCNCSNQDGSSNNKNKLTSSPNSVGNSSSNSTDLKTTNSSKSSGVGSSVSSISSNCSTPFLASKQANQPILESTSDANNAPSFRSNLVSATQTNCNLTKSTSSIQPPPVPAPAPLKHENFDDDLEEELIYSLSKLDNPFLLFICFSIFIEHRDHIMQTQMDANDIACYFDKMIRKHNMKTILNRARYLYTKLYLSKTNAFSYMQQLSEIHNSP